MRWTHIDYSTGLPANAGDRLLSGAVNEALSFAALKALTAAARIDLTTTLNSLTSKLGTKTAHAAGGQPKTVQDLIETSTKGRSTLGKSVQYERTGGYAAANKEFDSLGLSDIKPIKDGGRMGVLPDGSKVIVRSYSSGDRPTLEIQKANSRTQIKFRYGE